MQTDIHWKRVVLAGFLSEIGVIIAISSVMLSYKFLIVPGRTAGEYQQFNQIAAYYSAVPAASVATFLVCFQAVRKLESSFIVNALLMGVVATILAMSFLFNARPEDRKMYVASFAARIIAAYVAGLAAQRLQGAPNYDHAR